MGIDLRHLRDEYEFHQSRKGAETSNEATERSQPATMLGTGILSIPPIARLNLLDIRGRYRFPNEVQLRLPFPNERADTVSKCWICMYTIYFECGLRLPIPPLLIQSMHHYQLAIPQLMPNGKLEGSWSILDVSEEEETSGNEPNKPPPKALLFEEKLERLLAQPNQEWDEINVPKRLKASSLRKDFINIPTGIIKRVPSWVDWLFMIRGALRRLFGTPLFIEPLSLSDEEALIAELALDTMNVEFPNPKDHIAKKKKRKADGKPKRKVKVKRKKVSKAATPEMDVELQESKQDDQHVDVDCH
ncbi:hypothetical protein TIFTF001_037446 [Ficus carica]|uniref:Uncharacterized protein n=1 Tax=Ficus carica TaxID=3494 RepID=A0AA88E8R8_FICCA|nr:hypothetical protein TIFTF001_037446 [Ficus carica]